MDYVPPSKATIFFRGSDLFSLKMTSKVMLSVAAAYLFCLQLITSLCIFLKKLFYFKTTAFVQIW